MIVFRDMEFAGVRADVKAYNSVISACARGARWENAWEVLNALPRSAFVSWPCSHYVSVASC